MDQRVPPLPKRAGMAIEGCVFRRPFPISIDDCRKLHSMPFRRMTCNEGSCTSPLRLGGKTVAENYGQKEKDSLTTLEPEESAPLVEAEAPVVVRPPPAPADLLGKFRKDVAPEVITMFEKGDLTAAVVKKLARYANQLQVKYAKDLKRGKITSADLR